MSPLPRRKALLLLWAGLVLRGFAFAQDDVPLQFARLDLTDGRKLKNVTVKSYDAASQKLLVIADGKAMTIPIAIVPAPFVQKLKSAPPSGESVNTVKGSVVSAPRRTVTTAADQYFMEGSPGVRPARKSDGIIRVVPSRTAETSRSGGGMPSNATLEQHYEAARPRAHRYFRYEHQIGSNSISVTALEFELSPPSEVTGWTGRYRIEGKAFIESYDSKGGSFQRTTGTFEVTTEAKPGEAVKVVDFSRKS